jgi:hypothetical protein
MFSFISELETGVTKELSEDQNPYDTNMVEVFDGEDFEWIDNPNQPSQTSPGMTSRDSQGLQAERNGRKRPKFRVVKGGPGSGFHGHQGRPGEVGGSQAGTITPYGLKTVNIFKGGKIILTPDGEMLRNTEGTRSHTQIYARIVMKNPSDYDSKTVEYAKYIISGDWEEYTPVERAVMDKGYVSVEVDFMGGITVVASNGGMHVTPEEFNSLFRRIRSHIDRGRIDVPTADRIAIHFNSSFYSMSYDEVDTISGFTINQFGKPEAHYKEMLPASLVKQVKKRIVVRKKEAKCSQC